MTAAGATTIAARPRGRARALLLLSAFTLLLHLPFITQPVQGDEGMYLQMARETLKHPLTPLNFPYVFQGMRVNMAGHPHPPFDAYFLAFVWLVGGGFSVAFFHAAYLVFPLIIVWAGYHLAERFTPNPAWAALLLAASPLVQVNTNTLASPEAPMLAFLLAGAALFFDRRFVLAGICLALAGFSGLQALAVAPILLLDYAIRRERPPRAAWLAAAAPWTLFAGWQLLQWSLIGHLPAAMLYGYATGSSYGRPILKLTNALSLVQHLGIMVVFLPLARPRLAALAAGVPAGVLAELLVPRYRPGYEAWERMLLFLFVAAGVHALWWIWDRRRDQPFLAAWCLAYFGFALAAFFAGAARYLLPLAAPLVFLFARQFAANPRRLAAALGFSLFLGLNVSYAAYEFSLAYEKVPAPSSAPFLVNGEWGFRYYMEQQGGRPIEPGSVPARPGEWIVSSKLSLAANYDSLAEAIAMPMRSVDIAVHSPLRLTDRMPFTFSMRPLDTITYSRTSPFINAGAGWLATQFSGRLVYLPQPGTAIRLPIDTSWTHLHFVPFAATPGRAVFSVRSAEGRELFTETCDLNGGFAQPRDVVLPNVTGIVLTIEAPVQLRVGWGELNAW